MTVDIGRIRDPAVPYFVMGLTRMDPLRSSGPVVSAAYARPVIGIVLSIPIDLVQVFDIVIHVATGRVEPLRIASNAVVLAWATVILSGRPTAGFVGITVGSIGGSLALNGLFLAREGLTSSSSNAISRRLCAAWERLGARRIRSHVEQAL